MTRCPSYDLFPPGELAEVVARACRIPLELSRPADLDGCWVFGAGDMGRFTLDYLRRNGAHPAGFVDNAEALHGRTVDGVVVHRPEALRAEPRRWVVVASKQQAEAIEAQCRALGAERLVRSWHLIRCWAGKTIVPAYVSRAEDFVGRWTAYEDVGPVLADDRSRAVLAKAVRYQITFEDEDLPCFDENEYTFPGFPPSTWAEIVDCGAYDGDTLRLLLSRFSNLIHRYDAFEPDPVSLLRLRDAARTLPPSWDGQLTIHGVALGARRGTNRFRSVVGMGSAFDETGEQEVEQETLDEVLAGRSPTFIKADVEGAERDLLEGAIELIRRCRPALAVCVYHRPDHYREIPLWLDSLGLGYRLYLRHHTHYFTSTVCYAVPEK